MHRLRMLFLFLDAVGLVVFTIIGCDVALSLGLSTSTAILSGMITGCVGGVLRDMLCNQVPLLFRSELYASVSVITGGVYLFGPHLGLPHDPIAFAAMGCGLVLRMLAIRFGWNMPRFVYARDLY